MPQGKSVAKGGHKKKIVIRLKKITLPPLSIITLRVGQAIIIAALFVIPLIISTQHQNPFAFPKYIALVITTIISATMLLVFFNLTPKKELLQSPIINAVILLLLSFILASIFSKSPIVSMFGSRELWHLGLIGITSFVTTTLVVANIFTGDISTRLLLWTLTIVGTLLSALYLYSLLITGIPQESSLFYGITVSSSETLAGILAVTTAITSVMILMYKQANMKGLFTVLTLIQIITIFISGEVIIGSVVLILISLSTVHRFINRTLLKFAAAMVILAVSWILLGDSLSPYVDALTDQWANVKSIITDNYLTGVGPGMVSHLERTFGQQDTPVSNLFLYLFAAGGLVTAIPTILLVWQIIINYLPIQTRSVNILHLAGVAGASTWIVIHMFIAPTTTTLYFGSIVLGILAAQSYRAKYTQKESTSPKIKTAAVILIFGVLISYATIAYSRAETLYQQATLETNSEALSSITTAIETHPYDETFHYYRATLLTNFLAENATTVDTMEVRRNIDREIQLATGINENNPDIYIAAARVYGQLFREFPDNNLLMTGISYASLGVQKDPHSPVAFSTRAQVLALAQRYDSALSDIETAILLQDDYWPSYFTAADVAFALSDYDLARSYLTYVAENSEDIVIQRIAKSRLDSLPE